MGTKRIVGIIVFAVGLSLLVFAYRSANAPLEDISNTITGRYSNETMFYFIAGVAAVVGGGLLAIFRSRE